MQMNNVSIQSANFCGSAEAILLEINLFLSDLKKNHATKADFHLVHALVFNKEMSEGDVQKINQNLGNLYRQHHFDVLGGDTSTGSELSIFISTIVF